MIVTDWIVFFLWSWGATFTAYVVAQVVVAVKLRGGWRIVSLIPTLPMLLVGAWTVSAFWQNSNLWPILLIFVSPVALLFLVVVWLAFRAKHVATA